LHEKVRRLCNWLLHHDNAPYHTSFFTGKFPTKNNMAVVPTLLFWVSPTEGRTKRPEKKNKQIKETQ
jgi:hypothetical protein